MDRTRHSFMLFLLITIIQIFLLYVNLSHQETSLDTFLLFKRQTTVNANQPTAAIKCNGDARLCDLRFDQVTYPGTHNSAAYDLRIDCNQTVRNCLDSARVCSKQYAQCIVTYGMQCDAQASVCRQRNPKWLYWLCDGFNKTCRSNNAVCAAWNAVCTNSYKVCNVWANACEIDIPDWVLACFWENNPGFPIEKQLYDGIRIFDFDTCLVNNERAVFCHGMGPTRALGSELDPIFQVILNFMNANPNEVITLEFGDTDGDPAIISTYIQTKLEQYFINATTGHSMMYTPTDPNVPWVTLREMINKNTRIVIFYGRIYNNVLNRQPWIHSGRNWITESYSYASDDMKPDEITNSFIGHCSDNDTVIKGDLQTFGREKWQAIDCSVAIVPPSIEDAIKMGKRPGPFCLKDLSLAINFDVLKNVATYCYPRFRYFVRVRVDRYWQSSLFEVVNIMNEQNIRRFSNVTATSSTVNF